jgi:hypothetical protein
LEERARLTVEVRSEDDIRKGQFADIEVVEYGILKGHKDRRGVGGLTVRFEH